MTSLLNWYCKSTMNNYKLINGSRLKNNSSIMDSSLWEIYSIKEKKKKSARMVITSGTQQTFE